MFLLLGVAAACGLLRTIAPHVRNFATARELAKPGMQYVTLGKKVSYIDGVWSPDEIVKVMRGDWQLLEVGSERAAALRRAGCPYCLNADCRKLFPRSAPDVCDRCGSDVSTKEK